MKSPMLACAATLNDLKSGMLISPKIDGVRAVVNLDGVLQTRSGKAIANQYVQSLYSDILLSGLDGELVVGEATGDAVCRTTNAALSTTNGQPLVTWWIFDDFTNPKLPYFKRYLNARDRVVSLHGKLNIKIINTLPVMGCHTPQYLLALFLKQGYEGICARDPHANYKFGRSTLKERGLMKIKNFKDSEAIVLDVIELLHADGNAGNKLGALVCRDVNTSVEFHIGTGFNEQQRNEYWANRADMIGQLVTYRYFDYGVKHAPRFPVFHSFRADIKHFC